MINTYLFLDLFKENNVNDEHQMNLHLSFIAVFKFMFT